MTISYGDLRKGMAIEMDGNAYTVVDYQSQKMQQRAPVMRVRFKEIRTGKTVDKTFSGYDVKLTQAQVERRKSQYIYKDDNLYYFMDNETFEQIPLSDDQLGDAIDYLVEQTNVDVVMFKSVPIAIEMPITVDLEIVDSPPGVKGDTAQGATKPATLVTGKTINVPLFVNQGDSVKVDTRTGEYLSRV